MLLDIQSLINSEEFRATFRYYRQRCSIRNDALFLQFLPHGYLATTVSSVPVPHRKTAILAKLHLGMLITLYDDLADNPQLLNDSLLKELYKVPFSTETVERRSLTEYELGILDLGVYLGERMVDLSARLPHYDRLANFLKFDVEQFYQCNRFSQLVTGNPSAVNRYELALYGPHNMGMVAAGMIDLMASDPFHTAELGIMRTAFSLGQRIGRICNVMTTHDREEAEHDVTNELKAMRRESHHTGTLPVPGVPLAAWTPHALPGDQMLMRERELLREELLRLSTRITTFNINAYVKGLQTLQTLHEDMRALI